MKYEVEVDEKGDRFWQVNGKLHREDGPAIECANGSKLWYCNGNLHREDGPAIEWANGGKEWYRNGKRHREDGPAVEWYDPKYWFLNGIRCAKEEFLRKTQPVQELTVAELEARLGYRIKVVKG